MKKLLGALLLIGLGSAVTAIIVSARLAARQAANLAIEKATWKADKAALEAALDKARSQKQPGGVRVVTKTLPVDAPAKSSATEIMTRLVALKVTPAEQTRTSRQVIYLLEELVDSGTDALPPIHDFLARNQDIDYVFNPPDQGKGQRPRSVPDDFVMPPSLRFGLFDVTRLIGGDEAEKILAEVLSNTGRGLELAWLARTLQHSAPDKYRDSALTAARDLLSRSAVGSTNIMDRFERDQLFSVLMMYGDTSFIAQAQSQLFGPGGDVDRGALKYLQQVLGPQSVGLAIQGYDDPRITNPKSKEPFARLALNYVGLDPQADALYLKAIANMELSPDQRRNLIEDLNQDGFQNLKNPTAQDIQLIQTRINMIEQLARNTTDPVTIKALNEAYKDLQRMLQKLRAQTQPG